MKSHARYFHLYWAVLFFAGSLSGCGGKGPEPNTTLEQVTSRESVAKQDVKAINERLFASVKSAPTLKDYVLGEGDLLQVSVFETQDLKTQGRIGARGFISLPLVGAVQVAGITTQEAEQKIEGLYKAKYLQNPHVNIFVQEQVSGKITLMGAFKKTGTFPYLARQNLFEAMALGEGLTDTAGKMVQVRRGSRDSDKPSTSVIDLESLAKGGGEELNIEIKSGDVIYVPDAGMIYVDGAVRKPGNYPIKKKMNIPEAIIAAGGLKPIADQTVTLVRPRGDDQKPDIVKFSLNDLQANSGNIEVKDSDIVFVGTNKALAFFSSITLYGPFGGGGINLQNQ
ncbi:Polysaccharide export protein [Syntrophobacter sp. SbD1]|nr:Polysaccharide export protein [Syntrophobacter sp. SbD1]